jgi:hypothetical protein
LGLAALLGGPGGAINHHPAGLVRVWPPSVYGNLGLWWGRPYPRPPASST